MIWRYLLEVTNTVNASSIPGSTLKNCSNPNPKPDPSPNHYLSALAHPTPYPGPSPTLCPNSNSDSAFYTSCRIRFPLVQTVVPASLLQHSTSIILKHQEHESYLFLTRSLTLPQTKGFHWPNPCRLGPRERASICSRCSHTTGFDRTSKLCH